MCKEHICVWKVEGKALLDRRLPSSGLLRDVSWFKTDVLDYLSVTSSRDKLLKKRDV
jgi:hypothetical protein